MVNYKEIIDNLTKDDIIRIMSSLGCELYKEDDNALIFPTICHNEDIENASKKLYWYKDTHIFYCYTSCLSMSIFKFLQTYYKTRNIEYDWYNDIYKLIIGDKYDNNFSVVKTKDSFSFLEKYDSLDNIKLPTYNKNIINIYDHIYPPEWLEDNISEYAMDKYNIRYDIIDNKIIIPHYNIGGELVGIRSRLLNKEDVETLGKYIPVYIENHLYNHKLSMNLYGLDKNKDNIKNTGIVIVAESEKSVLQAESYNFPNVVVAVCGSKINKFQLNLLYKYCYPREIVIAFDNEENGKEDKYFNKLYNMCKKYNSITKFSFIYDRNNITKKKDSPFDNGEEIFIKLFNERVKVK